MAYYQSIITILIAIAIAFSGYMLYQDHTGSEVCIAGSGCSEVRHSTYGEIFGLKVSLFGTIATVALLAIHYATYKKKIPYKLFLLITYIGAAFAAYFLFLQFVVIGSICPYCVTVDSSMLLIFALANYEFFKLHKKH